MTFTLSAPGVEMAWYWHVSRFPKGPIATPMHGASPTVTTTPLRKSWPITVSNVVVSGEARMGETLEMPGEGPASKQQRRKAGSEPRERMSKRVR